MRKDKAKRRTIPDGRGKKIDHEAGPVPPIESPYPVAGNLLKDYPVILKPVQTGRVPDSLPYLQFLSLASEVKAVPDNLPGPAHAGYLQTLLI